MKEILLMLQASYWAPDVRGSRSWNIKGLDSLSLIPNNFIKNCDIVYFDNTVNSESELPDEIVCRIPENAKVICDKSANKYGRINKGAGCIEMLLHQKENIKLYKWHVHHEPRQVLRSGLFFQSFIDNPRNLFREGENAFGTRISPHRVHTATYAIESKKLVSFVDYVNLQEMCKNKIAIETILKDFLVRNKIQYSPITHLDIIWQDHVGPRERWKIF